jgi:hypothetical protein
MERHSHAFDPLQMTLASEFILFAVSKCQGWHTSVCKEAVTIKLMRWKRVNELSWMKMINRMKPGRLKVYVKLNIAWMTTYSQTPSQRGRLKQNEIMNYADLDEWNGMTMSLKSYSQINAKYVRQKDGSRLQIKAKEESKAKRCRF